MATDPNINPDPTPAPPPPGPPAPPPVAQPVPPQPNPQPVPPPPGPEPAPSEPEPQPVGAMMDTGGTMRAQSPVGLAVRTEGGPQMQEGPAAYLPDGSPIDNVGIVRATVKNPLTGADQEVTAAKTDPNAAPQALGSAVNVHEIGGQHIKEVLSPETEEHPVPVPPVELVQRWLDSAIYKRLGAAIARSPLDMGLIGQNHVVTAHMILMDADSGELVRVLPNTRIKDDRLFINTRNLPDFIVETSQAEKS